MNGDEKDEFPMEVKRGGSRVFIYLLKRKKTKADGRERSNEYRVRYYVEGVRKFASFTDLARAKERAAVILKDMEEGTVAALQLTGQDRISFQRASEILKPLGVSMESAASQFAESHNILGGGSIIEAARDFAKRNPTKRMQISVSNLVTEYVKIKTDADRSSRHLEDLRSRLSKLSTWFQCDVATLTEREFRQFFDGLKTKEGKKFSPRSRNNFLAAVTSLMRFAQRKKYLPADWNELSTIESVEDNDGEIEIFTPDEMTKLLNNAPDDLKPFLAIGAFAGLRSSEICRLDWKQVGIGDGKYIELRPKQARKKKQRRLIPIQDNLKAWLANATNRQGPVWMHGHSHIYERLEAVTKAAEVPWRDNGMRHSYISYRMAETSDAAKVSLEAGNSPKMIFDNYRELVTPEEAKEWFAIFPKIVVDKICRKCKFACVIK
jgi:integrase